jgi:membrane protein DedA with SNARE-associated domain
MGPQTATASYVLNPDRAKLGVLPWPRLKRVCLQNHLSDKNVSRETFLSDGVKKSDEPMAVTVEIEHLFGSLAPFVHHYGAAAVTVVLTFESFGAPLPGESLLVFASILAGRGEISLPVLMFSSWVGAVSGDNIGYLLGRRFGRGIILRYGAKFGANAERLGKVEAVFARYGAVTVAFARFVNVLRQLNGVVAGMLRMDWKRFLLFNALGGALWVTVWTVAGFYLGKHAANLAAVAHDLEHGGAVLGAGVLLAALVYAAAHRALRGKWFL